MIGRNLANSLSMLMAALLAGGCGSGTAVVVGLANGNGGGSTPTVLTSFTVPAPRVSPATLQLGISGGAPVTASLFYQPPSGVRRPMTKLVGVSGNAVVLSAPGAEFSWKFAEEPDLAGERFVADVKLVVEFPGGVPDGGELTLGIGNDPPEVLAIVPVLSAGEAAGNVEVGLGVSDSSSDPVTIAVDWRRASDAPDAWRPASVGGVPTSVGTDVDGEFFSFFWRTESDGLGSDDEDFQLRVTADDGTLDQGQQVGKGELVSNPFRVDNNEEPIVQLDSGPLILNPDERRGIPIPFRVIDEEGDLVEVILQWRHEGEEFPELPPEMPALEEILNDNALRQEKHICTPYPRYAQGSVVPIDENTVRLPELASSESWIVPSGIVGRTLELLRPSSIPTLPTWNQNPLVSPIAALPVGDGLRALVLDNPGNGRLLEIELANGLIVGGREIATLGPGIPTTMAFERGDKAVLVALGDAETWRIDRIELDSSDPTPLIASDGSESVRGIASLGTKALVFTRGSSLFHLDYRDALAPQLGELLTDLESPWGVAVDPLQPHRIYVSERDANRLLTIELDSHERSVVVVRTDDLQLGTLEAPEAIALEGQGSRLLILTREPGGGHQLVGLDLGARGGNRWFPIGESHVPAVSHVASGSDELRLLCLPTSNELLVAGGIEQRRRIAAHSPSTQELSVDAPFDPVPAPTQPWRIPEGDQRVRASGGGTAGRFVWDSTDAPGPVAIRARARDNEMGGPADGASTKRVRAGLEVEPLVLGDPATTSEPVFVAAADIDGDGYRDLVSANRSGNDLTVFFQRAPQSFQSITLGGSSITRGPVSVAIGDLDGDGNLDLASANQDGDDLTVFFQRTPDFSDPPRVLGGASITRGPVAVAVGDLDGDGLQDLVSANRTGNNLTIFFQGSFGSDPRVLGGPAITRGPVSVAIGDLDGDGLLDLASANEEGVSLTVFFQLPDDPGTFRAEPLSLGGPFDAFPPHAVAIGDLDGDGDQDLISGNAGARRDDFGGTLTVFFQDAPGTFGTEPLVIETSTTPLGSVFPRSLAVVDVDDDGDLDIVSANAGTFAASGVNSTDLRIFFQEAPGRFAPPPPVAIGGLPTTDSPLSVVADDLDGDGDMDLASANADGNDLTVFFQDSAGNFAAPPLPLGGDETTASPLSIAAGDLDGDGEQDLLTTNAAGNNLQIVLQKSPGVFQPTPTTLDHSLLSAPTSVAIGDLDGDGDQDVVSANLRPIFPLIFLQETPGSFSSRLQGTDAGESLNSPRFVAIGDFDDDGDQDLVYANTGDSNLKLFHQEPPGQFTSLVLRRGGPSTTNSPFSVAVGDLDGNGGLDLVSANKDGNNLTIFFQEPLGNIETQPLVVGGPSVTRGPVFVAVGDIDGDGGLDLVSANQDGNDLTTFLQLSPRSFAAPLLLGGSSITSAPVAVALADLDLDGDKDLVSANQEGNDLTVFFQTSPGRFVLPPFFLGGPGSTNGPHSLVTTDLDGDGDQDLVSANQFGNDLTVFFGGR